MPSEQTIESLSNLCPCGMLSNISGLRKELWSSFDLAMAYTIPLSMLLMLLQDVPKVLVQFCNCNHQKMTRQEKNMIFI